MTSSFWKTPAPKSTPNFTNFWATPTPKDPAPAPVWRTPEQKPATDLSEFWQAPPANEPQNLEGFWKNPGQQPSEPELVIDFSGVTNDSESIESYLVGLYDKGIDLDGLGLDLVFGPEDPGYQTGGTPPYLQLETTSERDEAILFMHTFSDQEVQTIRFDWNFAVTEEGASEDLQAYVMAFSNLDLFESAIIGDGIDAEDPLEWILNNPAIAFQQLSTTSAITEPSQAGSSGWQTSSIDVPIDRLTAEQWSQWADGDAEDVDIEDFRDLDGLGHLFVFWGITSLNQNDGSDGEVIFAPLRMEDAPHAYLGIDNITLVGFPEEGWSQLFAVDEPLT